MYIEGFEQMTKINKTLTGPLSEWNHVTIEIYRRMLQQHLELMGENFSRISEQLKRFSDIKKPEDFFNLQKDCLNENINTTIESFHKLMRISMLGFEEYSKLFGSLRDTVTNNLKDNIKNAEKASEKFSEKSHK